MQEDAFIATNFRSKTDLYLQLRDKGKTKNFLNVHNFFSWISRCYLHKQIAITTSFLNLYQEQNFSLHRNQLYI